MEPHAKSQSRKVKKREDNKYNKNYDFIPLGINNLYSFIYFFLYH